MVNLFDIMRNAEHGAALHNMSRRFSLSPADTQKAVDALLPAFALGFQKAVHDPAAFAELFRMIASGTYAPVFDGLGGMASAQSGVPILAQIFGSEAVSRKVAEQAASATGLGVEILHQMLPMMAATLIGGAFRYASLQGLGDLFARWSAAFHAAHDAQQPAPPPNAANPLEMWTALLNPGGARAQRASRASAPQDPAHAWSAMVDAMLGNKPAPPKPPEPPNPVQILAGMFETGSHAQAQYVEGLKAMMDNVWQAGRAH